DRVPDGRVPLHPPELSEDALSLLPDQDRRAVLWTVQVSSDGSLGTATVERALVRSIARLDYEAVQSASDSGSPHPSVEALADLGRARRAARVAAGALELGLPEQEVEADGDGWAVRWRRRAEADDWNAEVSLLTGMAAARMMLEASVGVLRVLPEADDRDVRRFLQRAEALGVDVGQRSAAEVLAGLDPARPLHVALMNDGARLLRGAGYVAFDGAPPEQSHHAGIGGPYAQVTAPLRRLADRYGTEVCLALAAGSPVPEWVRTALVRLPDAMKEADRRANAADRGATDLAEAVMLQGRVGETFRATVVRADEDRVTVMLEEPSVLAACTGEGLQEGAEISVVLESADVSAGKVTFRPV
ncbi:MAG: RNB domain-containing ribonuclease, partial [Actinomycetales bacterium]